MERCFRNANNPEQAPNLCGPSFVPGRERAKGAFLYEATLNSDKE